jgi:hypothetical protein
MKRLILYVMCFVLYTEYCLYSATYYVSTSGSDANDGKSLSTAWKTITKAGSSTSGGDTVLVQSGTYIETADITVSGSPNNYITFKADGACLVKPGTGKGIRIAGSYIIVDGFEVTTYVEGINIRNSHIKILNCKVHDGLSSGSNGLTVNFPAGGLEDIYIENCEFYNNENNGADFGCNAGTDKLTNLTLVNCKFHDNKCTGGTDGVCIGHYGTKSNISFIRCKAYNNLSDGFDLDAPVYMEGCIAYNNSLPGGPTWGAGFKLGASNHPCKVYNCIAYNNYQDDGEGGIEIGGDNSVIANCLVYNNTNWGGIIIGGKNIRITNTIIYKEKIAVVNNGGSFSFDHNIVYNCTSNGALTSSDLTSSIQADPLFINVSSYDFHLQSISPAIDSGTSISDLTLDADGYRRPIGSGYDIGPYEFGSGPITPPSSSGGNTKIQVLIYPNPWRLTDNSFIKFVNIPSGLSLTMRIFDSNGNLVRTLLYSDFGSSGRMSWNGKDENGSPVASGVYYFTLEGDGNGKGKFCIVK